MKKLKKFETVIIGTGQSGLSTSYAVHFPNGCDYSHLVGSPVKQPDERFDAEEFDALLTDYDRILLRFCMRTSW